MAYTSLLDRLGLHRRELRAWALYDVANSAFMTTVLMIFPVYFVRVPAEGLAAEVARSRFAFATSIAVVIEKNPFPLAGKFDFKDGALPFVKLNVKMGETSDVRVLAVAGGKHFVATREIKVTIGGCGG